MWAATGSLGNARYFHTATLLPSGKVLVAGGIIGNLGAAELYDPASGAWTTASNPAVASRSSHTATLLPNGKVLVAGGTDGTSYFTSAELYDPANGPNGTWTATGSLLNARSNQTATLLPGGSVLFAAGFNGAQRIESAKYLASAELYDSSNGSWAATGGLEIPRVQHTATLLPNGKVLVAGGDSFGTAELYANGNWTATSSLNAARDLHTATLLPNGKVLVAGGEDNFEISQARRSTIRRADNGLPPAASTPPAMITRQPCCPTARCWLQGDLVITVAVRNSTIRRAALGRRLGASPSVGILTRRPCCPAARCWLQGESY